VYGICGKADAFGAADVTETPVLYALDRRTGAKLWDVPANWFVLGADMVYVPCENNGAICALEQSRGRVRWRQPVKYGFSGFVTERDGVAYIGGGATEGAFDPNTTAVDALTGKALWRYSAGDGTRTGGALTAVTTSSRQLYLVTSDGQIHALDRASGALQWRAATAAQVHNPAVVDDLIYILGADGALVALDRATGQPRWRLALRLPDPYRVTLQAIAGQLYIWGATGRLLAIGLAERSLTWEDQLSPDSNPIVLADQALLGGVEFRGTSSGAIAAYPAAGPPAPGEPTQLRTRAVINGGNLRRAAQIDVANVAGQVCPGDQLVVLQQAPAGDQVWLRVRVVALGASCDSRRAPLGSAGWVSSTLTSG
jgi:outer membrane protein assembly factor BamB